jgi:threonine dehydrogenase-like Zn-dependent dehydrogenase
MRLDLVKQFGAFKTVTVDKDNLVEIVMAETEGYGANVVFEVARVESLRSLSKCMYQST